jgi:hypothetical protein
MCANHARIVSRREAAAVLWKMARGYQQRAADLDNGRLPDIGVPPSEISAESPTSVFRTDVT